MDSLFWIVGEDGACLFGKRSDGELQIVGMCLALNEVIMPEPEAPAVIILSVTAEALES